MSNKKFGYPIKILMLLGQDFLIPKIDPRVFKEAQTLIANGYEITVCCLSNKSAKKEIFKNIKIVRIKDQANLTSYKNKKIFLALPQMIGGTLINLYYILEFSLKNKFDFIHCHDADTILAGTLIKIFKFGQIKLIYDSHEIATEMSSFRRFRLGIYFIEKLCSYFIDGFITINDSLLSFLVRRFPRLKKNNLVLKNVPEIKDYIQPKKVGETINFIYQGTVKKGRIEVLETIVQILLRSPERWRMTILTNPEEIPSKSCLRNSKIIIKEMIQDPKKFRTTLSQFDLGIIAMDSSCLNHYYSLPNKLFDYMNAGVAVLASDFPVIRQVITKTQTGWLFTEKNIESIIKDIFCQKKNLQQKKGNGPRAIEKNYNWSIEEQKLIKFYKRVSSS